MEVMSRASVGLMAVLALILAAVLPANIMADSAVGVLAPVPSPTSDGTSVDQGIAYILMLVALVLTYIMH